MQKHLDWKRVGWLFIILALIFLGTYGAWLLGDLIYGDEYIFYNWLVGFWFIFAFCLLCVGVYLFRSHVIPYYYHNGKTKNPQGYKLPLPQCDICKVKKHCLVIKVRSCPNMLGEVKSAKR